MAVRTSLGMSGPKLGHFVPLKFCSVAGGEEEVRRQDLQDLAGLLIYVSLDFCGLECTQ